MFTKENLMKMDGELLLNIRTDRIVKIHHPELGDENTVVVQFHNGGCGSMPIKWLRYPTFGELLRSSFEHDKNI